jgi:hypothetical protein
MQISVRRIITLRAFPSIVHWRNYPRTRTEIFEPVKRLDVLCSFPGRDIVFLNSADFSVVTPRNSEGARHFGGAYRHILLISCLALSVKMEAMCLPGTLGSLGTIRIHRRDDVTSGCTSRAVGTRIAFVGDEALAQLLSFPRNLRVTTGFRNQACIVASPLAQGCSRLSKTAWRRICGVHQLSPQ